MVERFKGNEDSGGEEMIITKDKIIRWLVVFKFTLQRGYAWCQLPVLAIMGAGIILPYIQQYGFKIRFWQLSFFALVVFMLTGWIDRRLKLLHAENNYTTETNPLLMQGLRGELK